MVSVSSVRNKLQAKVFDKLGSNITIEAYSSDVTNKWGDATTTYAAGTSSQAVPYNYLKQQLRWQPFSDFQEGNVIIVVPYGTSVSPNDKITYDGQTWYVRQIEEFPMGDGTTNYNLATGIELTRSL